MMVFRVNLTWLEPTRWRNFTVDVVIFVKDIEQFLFFLIIQSVTKNTQGPWDMRILKRISVILKGILGFIV